MPRRFLAVAVALAAAAPAALAKDRQPDPIMHPRVVAEAGIGELFRQLNDARVRKDRAALERLYADGFLWIHNSGYIADRNAQIEDLLASDPTRPIPAPQVAEIVVHGSMALVRSPRSSFISTSLYVQTDGRWQILQIQGTPLAATREAAPVDPAVLDSYTGVYSQPNGITVTITREGASLMIQASGRGPRALTAASDTRFYDPFDAEWTFSKDAAGKMSYVRKTRDGQETTGTRTGAP